MTQPMRGRLTCRAEVFGVCFRPGGVCPFFSCSAIELVNSCAGIDDLWGSGGLAIANRIQDDGHTIKERGNLLDRHVRKVIP
jgi:hypothetical protein